MQGKEEAARSAQDHLERAETRVLLLVLRLVLGLVLPVVLLRLDLGLVCGRCGRLEGGRVYALQGRERANENLRRNFRV